MFQAEGQHVQRSGGRKGRSAFRNRKQFRRGRRVAEDFGEVLCVYTCQCERSRDQSQASQVMAGSLECIHSADGKHESILQRDSFIYAASLD